MACVLDLFGGEVGTIFWWFDDVVTGGGGECVCRGIAGVSVDEVGGSGRGDGLWCRACEVRR